MNSLLRHALYGFVPTFALVASACGGNLVPPQATNFSVSAHEAARQTPSQNGTSAQSLAQVTGSLDGVTIKALQAVYMPVENQGKSGLTEIMVGEQNDLCAASQNLGIAGNLLRIEVFNDVGALETGDYSIFPEGGAPGTQATHWSIVSLSGIPAGGTADDGRYTQASGGSVSITAMPATDANTLNLTFSAADPDGGPGLAGQVTAVVCRGAKEQ